MNNYLKMHTVTSAKINKGDRVLVWDGTPESIQFAIAKEYDKSKRKWTFTQENKELKLGEIIGAFKVSPPNVGKEPATIPTVRGKQLPLFWEWTTEGELILGYEGEKRNQLLGTIKEVRGCWDVQNKCGTMHHTLSTLDKAKKDLIDWYSEHIGIAELHNIVSNNPPEYLRGEESNTARTMIWAPELHEV